jgi:hypothetical protein
MAKKKASPAKSQPDDAVEFLRGDLASRHLDELMQQSIAIQLTVRRAYDPKPSEGGCTPKRICTAGILCLITEGKGRIGCEPTGVFRPDCKLLA